MYFYFRVTYRNKRTGVVREKYFILGNKRKALQAIRADRAAEVVR